MADGNTPTSPGFSPADLEEIGKALERRLGSTLAKTERETSEERDLIKIWVAGSIEPVYRLERDRTGYCYLVYCDANNWRVMESGSLESCTNLYKSIFS